MLVFFVGFLTLLTFLNILYYEYYYKKSYKREIDLMNSYMELDRLRKSRNV